jgi:hypothetical protein
MPSVTTEPEMLIASMAGLHGVGTTMSAESAGAATRPPSSAAWL